MLRGPNRRNGRGDPKARTIPMAPDLVRRMSGRAAPIILTAPSRTRRTIRMDPGRRAARLDPGPIRRTARTGIRARRFWRIPNP